MKLLPIALGFGIALALPTHEDSSDFPELTLTNITMTEFSNGLNARDFSGPVMGVDFPDPSIIWGDGSWKAYGTSSNGKTIPVATSGDARSWTLTTSDALPDPGPWIDPNDRGIWAPDVNKNDAGVYIMYYTGKQKGGSHCIGVATSKTALGPFQPWSNPLICDAAGGGVIDASGYDDGKDRWITWKVDGNSLGGATTCQGGKPSGDYKPTPIKIQKLARDATTLLGSPKTILDNWGASNNGVVEAPTLYKISDGRFVLFYSAHCYSSDDYDIEYAFSNTIDGQYTNRGVLLRSADNRGVFGPGGLDLDPNGKNVLFHGRKVANRGGDPRYMYSGVLSLSGNSASI